VSLLDCLRLQWRRCKGFFMQLIGSYMVCVRTTTWRQHSRSGCISCRSSNGSTINHASLCTKWLFVKRHPTWLACWLQSLRYHHYRLLVTRQTATTSFPGPVWNSARGRFAPRASNRVPTELKLMRSTPVFKRSLKTFLFQTAYCT